MAPETALRRAVDDLHAGRPVGMPTETVYGLAAPALDEPSVRRVFELKGRPASNPLIVHAADAGMARAVTSAWSDEADRLAAEFWPGPLTLVLPKDPSVPDSVTAGGPTVAVRVPDHPLALALIEAFDAPLVAPSANRSGRVSPTTADHVRAEFGDDVFVLDGGPCRAGLESAVLDLSTRPARVLRPGILSAEEIERVLGREVVVAGTHSIKAASARSPGSVGPHYQPAAPLRLVDAPQADSTFVVSHLPEDQREGAGWILMPPDAPTYAARLYAAMREADDARPARIDWIRPPNRAVRDDNTPHAPENGAIWAAVLERLTRAADN